MTPEQRCILDQWAECDDEPIVLFGEGDRAALRAALADLDRLTDERDSCRVERNVLRLALDKGAAKYCATRDALDACRAALAPVAREILNWRTGGDHRAHAPDRAYLNDAEAVAVLAAALGGAVPPTGSEVAAAVWRSDAIVDRNAARQAAAQAEEQP